MMDGFDMNASGWVMMIGLWALLLLVVVWAISRLTDRPAESREERPIEILDRRLARGEIDTATYEELRAKLTQTTPRST